MDGTYKDLILAASCFMAGAGATAIYFTTRLRGLVGASTRVSELEEELSKQRYETLNAIKEATASSTELAQMKKYMEEHKEEWKQTKDNLLQAANAAVVEVGNKVSNNLIEQARRENEEAKKEAEQTTSKVFEQFQNVVKSLHTLDEQVQKNNKQSEIVWRALTSPQSAGYFGEIGLENTLKSFGLEEGRDFRLQFSITTEDGRFRPDAVVFLPSSAVLVIDSKATQVVLEMATAEQNGHLETMLPRLKESMNSQLKNLAGKEYDKAVREIYREQGRIDELGDVVKIMYVPSESAFGYIAKADETFMQKAAQAKIILAGPQSLAGLIALANIKIQETRQIENYQRIMDSVRDFMGRVATALSYADNVGRAITKAQENFDSFAKSVNTRLLPKVKDLGKLGLTHNGKKDFPARLQESTPSTIEIEAEEADEVPAIGNKKEAA